MLISIITNCFNSSATLHSTYKSLEKQTIQNFEWILIDDCSNDGDKTRNLIKHYSKIASFPVKYKFLDTNYYGSKSTFTACTIAEGEYACILDHDDELYENTIERVIQYIEKNKEDKTFVGVCGRCIDEDGILIGSKFSFLEKISTESEIRFKYKNTSEFLHFTKVNVMKEVFSKMKRGYTNGFCWVYITQTYRYLYINDVFRIYNTRVSTSHSNTKKINKSTVEGQLEGLKYIINSQAKYFKYNMSYSIRLLYQFLVYSHISKENLFRNIKGVIFPINLVICFFYPFLFPFVKKYK